MAYVCERNMSFMPTEVQEILILTHMVVQYVQHLPEEWSSPSPMTVEGQDQTERRLSSHLPRLRAVALPARTSRKLVSGFPYFHRCSSLVFLISAQLTMMTWPKRRKLTVFPDHPNCTAGHICQHVIDCVVRAWISQKPPVRVVPL